MVGDAISVSICGNDPANAVFVAIPFRNGNFIGIAIQFHWKVNNSIGDSIFLVSLTEQKVALSSDKANAEGRDEDFFRYRKSQFLWQSGSFFRQVSQFEAGIVVLSSTCSFFF